MFNEIIEILTEKLMAWCERTGRVLRITGTGGEDDIYLIRYYVVKSRFFNIFIHQFMRSDRDDLHDHPWDFATYLVRGSYSEVKWNKRLGQPELTFRDNNMHHLPEGRKTIARNRLVFRRATDQHKVMTQHDYAYSARDLAPLTICVTGPTKREWGFIRERDPKNFYELGVTELQSGKVREWVPWREYLGLPPEEPGRG